MRSSVIALLSLGTVGAALAQDFAPHVYLGLLPCELRQTATLRVNPDLPGHYVLNFKKHVFHMTLMATPSGAVRLEDPQAGVIWIQLNTKSMLMDQQRGVRLLDECQHPTQAAMAQAMRSSPPNSLLAEEPSR